MMRTGLDAWRVRSAGFPAEWTDAEKLRFLVNYAVLAPSKYNAQPWLFEICSDSLDIIRDRSWALREADPEGRELILSCGASLLNLTVAARHFGYAVQIQTFPWPGDRYSLARLRLSPLSRDKAKPKSPLAGRASNCLCSANSTNWAAAEPFDDDCFEAIRNRCTSRRPFRTGAPPEEAMGACVEAVFAYGAWFHFIRDEPARRAVAQLVAQGDREQMANKLLRRELRRWTHSRRGRSRDGFRVSRYGLYGAMSLLTPGFSALFWVFNLGRLNAAHDRRLAEKGPVLAVLGTELDNPQAWLSAGQALQQVLRRATVAGLSASFFNQPIEVGHLRNGLCQLAKRTGFPQILLRPGYGEPARHTPRRHAKEVVYSMRTLVLDRGAESGFDQMDAQTARQSFVVNIELGLHARPCALLVKTLRPFRSDVLVEANGEEASGHSIMGLMMLAAGLGSVITITITGEDAPQAMAAIGRLFVTRFADAYGSSRDSRDPKLL